MSTVETIQISSDDSPSQARWPEPPVIGQSALGVVARTLGLAVEDQETVLNETRDIFLNCLAPHVRPEERTGLVIGYVQSGKTLSFTTLAAMARDNSYQLIVVLAGTTSNLVEQSVNRLKRDLDIGRQRTWRLIKQPRGDRDADYQRLDSTLRKWRRRPGQLDRSATALIVTMKQHDNLRHLRRLLLKCDLDGVTALVIDDEGDQAGLNTRVKRGEESATYRELRLLREALPRHTYILYTATPQAPLLISRIDMLSPDFAGLLTPGEGYVGGRDYFFPNSPFLETIPSDEVPDGELSEDTPPSFIRAIRLFILGVAAGLLEGGDGNRSMMVHPSRLRDVHAAYFHWTSSVLKDWRQVLGAPLDDPDRQALLCEFRQTFDDLSKTVGLPSFDELVQELEDAIDDTLLSEMNTRDGEPVAAPDWTEQYGNILVGGMALDRGFTVEGLTVTYMPRSAGGGNADTIQQRGRFFGYKRSYLGYCRLFLEADTRAAFGNYIEHEEQMRSSILGFIREGRPLQEWRRAFFLDRRLRPTRASVLSTDYVRPKLTGGWSFPRAPHIVRELVGRNREIVDRFLHPIPPSPYTLDPRWTDDQTPPRHVLGAPLDAAYATLLTEITYPDEKDSLNLTLLLLQLERLIERSPDAICDVFLMAEAGDHRHRKLSGDGEGHLEGFFQGRNDPTGYPGAASICSARVPTIQIHRYDLTRGDDTVADDVPFIAIHIPAALRPDLIFQPHD